MHSDDRWGVCLQPSGPVVYSRTCMLVCSCMPCIASLIDLSQSIRNKVSFTCSTKEASQTGYRGLAASLEDERCCLVHNHHHFLHVFRSDAREQTCTRDNWPLLLYSTHNTQYRYNSRQAHSKPFLVLKAALVPMYSRNISLLRSKPFSKASCCSSSSMISMSQPNIHSCDHSSNKHSSSSSSWAKGFSR